MTAPGPPDRSGWWATQGRGVRSGPALCMVAVGAILTFAVTSSAIPGLNVNVVGIILLLIGLYALLMPMMNRPGAFRTISPWLRPRGYDNPRIDERKAAAEADDRALEADDRYFDPAGPGNRQRDDL